MDEISKISNFINPALPKGDIVGKPDDKHREKGKEHRKEEPAPAESHDDTLFSLEAIRALLKQENAEQDAESAAAFEKLQRRGVASIPIRAGEPILDAVKDAAARLDQK